MPGRSGWDHGEDLNKQSHYADLVRMRLLQLRVTFSICANETAQCKAHSELKTARLGVSEEEAFPSNYVVEGVVHHTIILHTDFCR